MNQHPVVYFVDDEAPMRESVHSWLTLSGFEIKTFELPEVLLGEINRDCRGVLLCDVKMPGMDGLELLRRIQSLDADLPVVLITGHGEIAMAVEAMRIGAYDFIEKPFDPEKLIDVLRRAGEKRRLVIEVRRLREQIDSQNGVEGRLLGISKGMEQLRHSVLKLAATTVNVLINGETGSGKELVARCLHDFSTRRDRPFVAINCAAIPESIFENELFGHEGGAFTGATRRRIGKVEHASGGTLFLDEIESMPLNLQVKLLRVLQESEVERLGSNQSISVDLRVVAASKADLRALSTAGRFRADLYYRLGVAELRIPALHQRKSDIPLLFEYFCARAARIHNVEVQPPTANDLRALVDYDWPGNIRELRNVAERYVLGIGTGVDWLVPSAVTVQTSADNSASQNGATDNLADQVRHFERRVIEQALIRHKGNIKAVLDELDIPRRTLNQKMITYGLARRDFRH